MSLEEKATTAIEKLRKISDKSRDLHRLIQKIMDNVRFSDKTVSYSVEAKQRLMAHYQDVKSQLEALVAELP